MQQLFEDFGEIAEFRLVYINEAHAADSSRPVPYAKDKNITEHDDFSERCETAEMLLNDKSLTIPFIIDNMNNHVNEAYSAWPDRVFLVRTDGRLAIAGDRGPWGFVPGLKAARDWLTEFKENGVEPALPEDAAPAGEDLDVDTLAKRRKAKVAPTPERAEDDNESGEEKNEDGG